MPVRRWHHCQHDEATEHWRILAMTTTMIDADYRGRTAASRLHYEQALAALPAGATRSLNSWPPYPVYLVSGRGSLVTDVDGRDYVDLLNNYSALILGHADPEIVDAVSEATALGTSFSFATPAEQELADVLRARVPSLERLRFAGSGTEAAMFCLRLARARTGRDRIAKMEGGFHGTYDDVAISIRPSADSWGP